MDISIKKVNHLLFPHIVSYFFTLVAILVTLFITRAIGPTVISGIELLTITIVVNLSFRFGKVFANLIKFVLLLLLNIQIFILLFSGTYTTSIMVTNLASIEALSGKAELYLTATVAVLVFSAIPTRKFNLDKKLSRISLLVILAMEVVLLNATQLSYSPSYSLFGLSRELYALYQAKVRIANMPNYTSKFYKENVEDSVPRPSTLGTKPNVVLIFAEGLSQNIIDDPRNIMPNLAKFQKESIDFDNYFNHTFATYRGIQGQLYSGYQLGDQDPNKLVSLQSILKDAGYTTTFINSEPKNKTFTDYLEDFGFDYITTTDQLEGTSETATDSDLYSLLWEETTRQAGKDSPFLVSTYSFGTHITLDSPDEKFGDGSDILLNRFHNLDSQFGDFLEKFNSSSISDNTVLIFTTDHATFIDNDFNKSFPNYPRSHGMIDEIPLSIYYKGIIPEVIDVRGRNSLALVPTILDYLDISGENYFLGKSLFNDANSIYDATFVSENTILTTSDASDGTMIKPFGSDLLPEFQSLLEKYYSSKLQGQ